MQCIMHRRAAAKTLARKARNKLEVSYSTHVRTANHLSITKALLVKPGRAFLCLLISLSTCELDMFINEANQYLSLRRLGQ